jgi:membrane-associated phospholipid phosphatase
MDLAERVTAVFLCSFGLGALLLGVWAEAAKRGPVLCAAALGPAYGLAAAWLRGRSVAWRGAAILIFMMATYSIMSPLTALVAPWNLAPVYRAMDQALGLDAIAWTTKITNAAVLDGFSAVYLSYLIYLHLTMLQMLLRGHILLPRFALGLVWVYVIGFAGYFLLPGYGPRYQYPAEFTNLAEGGLLTQFADALVRQARAEREIMPSMHVAVALYILAFDWKERRRRAARCTPWVAGIVASTVVLGFHYVVDILAGALSAAIGCYAAFRSRPLPDRAPSQAPRRIRMQCVID